MRPRHMRSPTQDSRWVRGRQDGLRSPIPTVSDSERAAVLACVRATEQRLVTDDDRLTAAEYAAPGLLAHVKSEPGELVRAPPQRLLEAERRAVDPEAAAVDRHLRVAVRQQRGQELHVRLGLDEPAHQAE